MIGFITGVAITGWIAALLMLWILPSRARRRELQQALRLRAQVGPYLQRRAMEHQASMPSEPFTSGGVQEPFTSGGVQEPFTSGGVQEPSVPHDLDEIVDHLCQLAGRLSELERSQMALNDTVNMAVSDTMPLDAK